MGKSDPWGLSRRQGAEGKSPGLSGEAGFLETHRIQLTQRVPEAPDAENRHQVTRGPHEEASIRGHKQR